MVNGNLFNAQVRGENQNISPEVFHLASMDGWNPAYVVMGTVAFENTKDSI